MSHKPLTPMSYSAIFLRICRAYTAVYPECSFAISFDGNPQPMIGNGQRIIPVNIRNAEKTFQRIFEEGSMGLGESYCEGNIEVADIDYKHFVFIFVRVPKNWKVLWKLPFLDIIRIYRATHGKPTANRGTQSANINSHYSLSDWFEDEKDSNDFYLQWLATPYVQYSCGKWDAETKILEEAQENKLAFYAKRLGLDNDGQ